MRFMYSCATLALIAATAAAPALAQQQDQKATEAQKLTTTDVDCTAAFTKVDADDNGFVSKQEANEALDRSFRKLDLDRNGRVSKAEYTACREYSELYAETESGFDWFVEADTDQDQKITKGEMAEASERQYQTDPKGMTQEEHARQTAWNFRKLDENNNGTLEFSEWRGTPVADEVIPGDYNQDQAIDAEEWQRHYRAADEQARATSQQSAAKQQQDNGRQPTSSQAMGEQEKGQVSRGISAGQAATSGAGERAAAGKTQTQATRADAEGMGEPSVWVYYLYVH